MTSFQVVKYGRNGSLLYPSGLLRDRGFTAQKCCIIGVFILLMVSAIIVSIMEPHNSFLELLRYLFTEVANCVALMSVLHLCIRVFMLLEDVLHLEARHNADVQVLLRKAFFFTMPSKIAVISSLVVSLWSFSIYGYTFIPVPRLLFLAAAFFIAYLTKMQKSPLEESIYLEEMCGVNYGSGMAYSFFYGYLTYVLPVTGDANKGIARRIDEYIAREGLQDSQFPIKKLIILIPSSTFIPCTLDENTGGWMQQAKSLEEQVFDVAGVTERTYKNSVYKIRDPNNPMSVYTYVVVEGATPLRTLNQVLKGSWKSEYTEFKKEIVHMFFKTLHRICKEDERIRDNCELLYYVDKDELGAPINLGTLIMDRVHDLKYNEEKWKYPHDVQ